MTKPIFYTDAFWVSPYSFSVFVALEEKRVPYELKTVALHEKEHRREPYRSLSITGRVPLLQHGGLHLAESSAIIEYLEETFVGPEHPSVFPQRREQRALARMVMAWMRSDFMPIREERTTTSLFYAKNQVPLSSKALDAAERLVECATHLVRDGHSPLFDRWSIADADLSLMLQRLHHNGYVLPLKLAAYADTQWKRPTVRKFVEQKRPPYVAY